MSYVPRTFYREDDSQVSTSREDEIRLLWEGWLPVRPGEPDRTKIRAYLADLDAAVEGISAALPASVQAILDGLDIPTTAELSNTFASLGDDGKVLPAQLPAGGGGGTDADLVSILPTPTLIAHRGAMNLYPENSAEGFRAAAESGYPFELDLKLLSDGTLIVLHDSNATALDRTMLNADGTPASGPITGITPEQWKSMRIRPVIPGGIQGTPVTVEDLIVEHGRRAVFFFELWDHATLNALLTLVAKHNISNSCVVLTFTRSVATAAAAAGLSTMFATGSTQTAPATLIADGIDWVAVNASMPDSYITTARDAGLKVVYYTTTDKAIIDAKVAVGAKAFMTDDPWDMGRRGPFQTMKRFAGLQNLWSGYRKRVVATSGTGHGVRLVPTGLRLDCPGSGYVETKHSWMGVLPQRVRVTVTAEYLADATAQDRMFSVTVAERPNSDTYYDGPTAGQSGYRLLVRRDGRLQLQRVAPSAHTSLAINTATTPFVGAGARGEVTVTFEINATNIKGTTEQGGGITHDIADTTWRGVGHLHLGVNGTSVIFKDVSVEAL